MVVDVPLRTVVRVQRQGVCVGGQVDGCPLAGSFFPFTSSLR